MTKNLVIKKFNILITPKNFHITWVIIADTADFVKWTCLALNSELSIVNFRDFQNENKGSIFSLPCKIPKYDNFITFPFKAIKGE